MRRALTCNVFIDVNNEAAVGIKSTQSSQHNIQITVLNVLTLSLYNRQYRDMAMM